MNNKVNRFWYLFILIVVMNVAIQLVHETGHWAVYQAFGRGPVWGFIGMVQVWDTPPLHPAEWVTTTSPDGTQGWLRLASPVNSKLEQLLASAAGPLASLLSATLGLYWLHKSRDVALKQIGLALSLTSSFVMGLYYLRSPMRTGGDEYDVASQLGIARQAVEIPFALAFIAILTLALYALPDWRSRLKWLAVILFTSIPTGLAMNFADGLVRAQVNLDNPLFLPVLGFSLPVFITGSLAILGLWAWWRATRKPARLSRQSAL